MFPSSCSHLGSEARLPRRRSPCPVSPARGRGCAPQGLASGGHGPALTRLHTTTRSGSHTRASGSASWVRNRVILPSSWPPSRVPTENKRAAAPLPWGEATARLSAEPSRKRGAGGAARGRAGGAAEAAAEAGFVQPRRGPGARSEHGNGFVCGDFCPFGGVLLFRCDSGLRWGGGVGRPRLIPQRNGGPAGPCRRLREPLVWAPVGLWRVLPQ